jgi:hypothetical protein
MHGFLLCPSEAIGKGYYIMLVLHHNYRRLASLPGLSLPPKLTVNEEN